MQSKKWKPAPVLFILALLGLTLTAVAGERGSWSGALADAQCKAQTPEAACPIDGATKAFGLVTPQGAFAPFDAAGNAKAADVIAKAGKEGNPSAQVSGELEAGKIKVDKLEVT